MVSRYGDQKTLHAHSWFSAHTKAFSPSKTFDPFNKNQKFKNYSELWQENLSDKFRSPRKKQPELLQAGKGQTVVHAVRENKTG